MEQEQMPNLGESQGASEVSAAEPMVPQSKVNGIVQARHAAGREKGFQEGIAHAQSQMGGMNQMSPDQIQRMIDETASRKVNEMIQRQQQEQMSQQYAAEGHRVANKFMHNLNTGKGEYEDFDNVFKVEDFQNMPDVIRLAADTDNTADVMYELAKNPSKAQAIDSLALKTPRLAQIEMQKLSDSIKKNKEAQKSKAADEPLSQIRRSNAGADNGSMSVTDFRKMFRG